MPRFKYLPALLALAGVALFFYLLVQLLLLRYERGDIYPEYSTFRADPMGARAYYEALESMQSGFAVRGFTSLHRELEKNPGEILYLGFDPYEVQSFTKREVAELDAYVKNGGRVVIAFAPESPDWTPADDKDKPAQAAEKKKEKEQQQSEDGKSGSKSGQPQEKSAEPPPDDNATAPKTEQEKYEREQLRKEKEALKKIGHNDDLDEPYSVSLAALWGFGWDTQKEKEKNTEGQGGDSSDETDKEISEVYAMRTGDGNLEPLVPWKSARYFARLDPEWQQLYAAKGKPVLMRRTWGKGEIIVSTDSYFLSNEALRNNRCPALLNFVAGANGPLLFDETHLGTQEQDGIVRLAEEFRIEGYALGMFGVLLLFIWRNSSPLVPPRAMRHGVMGGAVSGKDSRHGLINLLRRNIPTADILKTVFNEWKRGATPNRPQLRARLPEMEAILASPEAGKRERIIETYHQLREINSPSHHKGNYATKS